MTGVTKRYLMGRIRAALRRGRQPRVAIIGAGFGGLAAAVALRRIGVDDIFIIERGDGVGGTWRQNTYPGAACDIQSHLYSFSFAPNRNWSRTYAQQPEILAYLESVAETFDLNRHLLTDTKVCSIRWNPRSSSGISTSNPSPAEAGSASPADVVISAVGLFGEPKLPDISGLDRFAGRVMHTSRWDSRAALAGRRVAVIGTGASAVQVVPELAKIAAEVTVFQRTPPWMVPKDDRPFTAGGAGPVPPKSVGGTPRTLAAVEGTARQHRAATRRPAGRGPAGHRRGVSCAAHVSDEALRAALTPDYPFRCKRVLLGGDYYAALQQDNVTLVTDPIREVTETRSSHRRERRRRRRHRAGHRISDQPLSVGYRRGRGGRAVAARPLG